MQRAVSPRGRRAGLSVTHTNGSHATVSVKLGQYPG